MLEGMSKRVFKKVVRNILTPKQAKGYLMFLKIIFLAKVAGLRIAKVGHNGELLLNCKFPGARAIMQS